MAVQSLTPVLSYVPDLSQSRNSLAGKNKTGSLYGDSDSRQPVPYTRGASLSTEYYSSDSVSVQYTNKDGDSVTLNWQHIEYQKAQMSVTDNGSLSDDQWNQIVSRMRDEFKSLAEEVMKKFIESHGGTVEDSNKTDQTGQTQEAQVPEYWNAENTSQRIVDFATSFLDGFSGASSDFLKQIKAAIEEGFKQAKDILGDLPGPVNNLVNHTYELVMQKLEAWAKEKGIAPTDEQNGQGNTDQTQPVDELQNSTLSEPALAA
jgi:hypothetical protein